MRLAIIFVLLNLSGCFYADGWTQNSYLHSHFKEMRNRWVGSNIFYCSGCKKININKNYDEYYYSFISPYSETKGKCTTFYKVRKSDNVVVSWRFEGKKYDCLSMP